MLWAVYQQELDPLNNRFLSTALAALPVVVLFWLLVPRRWLAPKAGAAGAITAILIAWLVFGMSLPMATMAFVHGAGFGLLPVGWTIFNAMLLYNCTVVTGHFTVVRRSVAGLSGDARIQAILIGFAFGAFLEGAAGGGTPVAICGAILVGLGFDPFLAAVLCLVANTSPVAYGGLGTPLITLSGVTDIKAETLSTMAGHQLPLLSFVVPLYMVKIMCSWKKTLEVWPALLVAGGSFALFQFTFATIHNYIDNLVLYPMTDIGGGIFSLVVTAIFLQFWKPRSEWHFDDEVKAKARAAETMTPPPTDAHAAEAAALLSSGPTPPDDDKPLNARRIAVAWMPFAVMSVLLFMTGLVRQEEGRRERAGRGPIFLGPVQTQYKVPIPTLHKQVLRDAKLQDPSKPAHSESALFDFAWLTAPGTAVFIAALMSMVLLRMNRAQVAGVFRLTFFQMKIPIPTIACMLGLSYVTRYAGMDATLGRSLCRDGCPLSLLRGHPGLGGRLSDRHRCRQQRPVRQPAEDHGDRGLQDRGVRPPGAGPGPGADLHRQQHGRRDGQDDRRPEHLRRHGSDQPDRPRGRHFQGGHLAQHVAGNHRGPDDAVASVCAAVHEAGAMRLRKPTGGNSWVVHAAFAVGRALMSNSPKISSCDRPRAAGGPFCSISSLKICRFRSRTSAIRPSIVLWVTKRVTKTRSRRQPPLLGLHPRCPTKASLLFDMVVSCSSLQGSTWLESAGAVEAENQALRVLADLAGLPASAGGCFVSGGSAGNLSALVVARDTRHTGGAAAPARLRLAVSDEAHSSIGKALHVLGVGP